MCWCRLPDWDRASSTSARGAVTGPRAQRQLARRWRGRRHRPRATSLADAEPELSVHVCFSGPRALLTRVLPPYAAPPALSALELTGSNTVARGGTWARAVELSR